MRVAKFVGAVLVGLMISAALVVGLIKLSFLFDMPPYLMILRSSDGQAFVHFEQRDPGLTTREIPVDIAVDATRIVELTDDNIKIPGVSIEFYDNAPSPGRFRMRIGSTRLDIMEAYYIVNGNTYGWTGESRHFGK
jgi:hypothetical protein